MEKRCNVISKSKIDFETNLNTIESNDFFKNEVKKLYPRLIERKRRTIKKEYLVVKKIHKKTLIFKLFASFLRNLSEPNNKRNGKYH